MSEITRYEINEQGELPLSYGRYVRWEDVQDLIEHYEQEIERLEDAVVDESSYSDGFDDGYDTGYVAGRESLA